MSKPSVSPYRRNTYNNNNGRNISPYREEPYKLAQKSKLSHSYIADHNNPTERKGVREDPYRQTEKKKHYEMQAHGRLDTLLEQNKYLLAENNQLSNLLTDRSRIIIALEQKLEAQMAQEVRTLQEIEFQKNRFLEEYSLKMREHNHHNERLMDQIAQLNEDIYQLELKKNKQIQLLKEQYSRQHKQTLENILTTHAQTIDLLQVENTKLKDQITDRDNQIERLNHEHKSSSDRFKHQCQDLQKNLAHALHMKKLELSEQKIEFEKIIDEVKRNAKKQEEITSIQYENELKKVKKQLSVKQVESEKLSNELLEDKVDSQIKINELFHRKGELQKEISELQLFQKTLIFNETERIKKLADTQLETTQNTHKQLVQGLKSQNKKLQEMNETKNEEIRKLHQEIDDTRINNVQECDDLKSEIQRLRRIIQQEKGAYEEENQEFKVKMAHLRNADIKSLQTYYQNEMATMAQDLQAKDEIIGENREKIHYEIQEKAEMRKHFQIEVSKLKTKIGELELRLAGVTNERKEEIANFGSQMQLTSMTLVRTTEQKQKYAAFSGAEKKKLQNMIADKDKQIEQLIQKINLLQANHEKEINDKDEEIAILKKTIEDLEQNLKKQKFFLQNEIRKKQNINKNDKQFYESQIERVKRQGAQQYNKLMQDLSKEKSYIEAERSKLKHAEKNLQNQLNLINQARQQQGIDRDIALHESQNRLLTEKELLQVSLKSHYHQQIQAKNQQIRDLKQQISELNTDIRTHISKEQKLEQKLQKLLQSQEKLRDMEQRVLNMGQENNLVKNLAEIVKNRKR